MPDKSFFRGRQRLLLALGGLLLVMAAGVVGYSAPAWFEERALAAKLADFAPPTVPAGIAGAFAADFARMQEADAPVLLPDLPFTGPDGAPVRLSDFEGQHVLVNFWATWCAPCVVELPSLDRFARHYEEDLKVIGVALEAGKEREEILTFLERLGVGDFAAYSDESGEFSAKLALRGLPTSFLIGKNGFVMYRFEGDADWTSPRAKAFFDAYLFPAGG